MKKDYYSIAVDDYSFLTDTLHSVHYNNLCINIQQVCEKLLKSALLIADTQEVYDKYLNSHNLKAIAECLYELGAFDVRSRTLTSLGSMYFVLRYPGEENIVATKEDTITYLRTMYGVFEAVNNYRRNHGMPCFTYEERYLEENQNNLEYILGMYFTRYNIKSVTDKINELSRLKELSGTDDNDELVEFIKENFL